MVTDSGGKDIGGNNRSVSCPSKWGDLYLASVIGELIL